MNIATRKMIIVAAFGSLAVAGCDQAQRQQMSDNSATPNASREISPKNSPMPRDTARDAARDPTADAGKPGMTDPTAKPSTSGSVAQAVDDAAITAKVKTALAADKDVKSSDISVKTTQGRVMLSGKVSDPSQAKLAEQKVAQIDGVQGVDNRLQTN